MKLVVYNYFTAFSLGLTVLDVKEGLTIAVLITAILLNVSKILNKEK